MTKFDGVVFSSSSSSFFSLAFDLDLQINTVWPFKSFSFEYRKKRLKQFDLHRVIINLLNRLNRFSISFIDIHIDFFANHHSVDRVLM